MLGWNSLAHVPEFTSQLKTQTKENLVNIMHVGVYMCLAFPFRSRLKHLFSVHYIYIMEKESSIRSYKGISDNIC